MKHVMYSDTASKPSSPNVMRRQFALEKTSDISGRVSVHSVEFRRLVSAVTADGILNTRADARE